MSIKYESIQKYPSKDYFNVNVVLLDMQNNILLDIDFYSRKEP